MLRTFALVIAAVLGVAAACELLLRLLPVSSATLTGYYIDPAILSYPPGHRWTTAAGWDLRNSQRLRANNMGFVANHDFVPDASAVALIGDSFVEASMLDAVDRPDAQLERALASARRVYAMGGPGSALLDYAERIRWSARQFGTRDVVVMMERGDVRQSLCGSGNVHAACLDPKALTPRIETLTEGSPAKRLLRHSALAQYLVSQLKLEPAALWRQAIKQSRPVVTPTSTPEPVPAHGVVIPTKPAPSAGVAAHPDMRIVDTVVERFFSRVDGQIIGRLVIVLDADRARLRQRLPTDDPQRLRFIERARAHGAIVVDTEPLYAAHYAQSSLRLEVGPHDAHLNRLGVEIAMAAAARALAGTTRGPDAQLPIAPAGVTLSGGR